MLRSGQFFEWYKPGDLVKLIINYLAEILILLLILKEKIYNTYTSVIHLYSDLIGLSG